MVGRLVILDDFRYPQNEFTNTGAQFVFVGDRSRGMYYVALDREWVVAYEAVKRFRDEVSGDLPKVWTIAGVITGSEMLVPMAGEDKTMPAVFGWRVRPAAIYLHPSDVEAAFGFAEAADVLEVSAESVAELAGLLA